jgi:nitrate reductase delta subunit
MRRTYDILADLLDYPSADISLPPDEWRELLGTDTPALLSELLLFSEQSESLSLSDLQELYTRTFDLNPVCALEIGYHLFGENYKRGAFLANLRETEAPFDLNQEHQLPDYLPVLLRLLTRLDHDDLCNALIADCIIPALDKMLRMLGESENPYRHLLAAITALLRLETGSRTPNGQRAQLPVLQSVAFSAANNTDLF